MTEGMSVERYTTVRARITATVKNEAADVLGQMGLSVSDAIRMMLIRIAQEKALPFDVEIPNAETRTAIADARQDKGSRLPDVASLMADLNADV